MTPIPTVDPFLILRTLNSLINQALDYSSPISI